MSILNGHFDGLVRALMGSDFQKWVSTCFLRSKNPLKCFKLATKSQGSQECCTITHVQQAISTQV